MRKIVLMMMFAVVSLMAWDNGKVVTVIDGDTVMLKKESGEVVKCRLIGLDTFETKVNHRAFKQLETLKLIHPKKKHSIKEVLCLGWKAHEFTKKRVLNKKVEYHFYKKDQYGRDLIYIKSLNYLLIRYGLAVQYPTNLLHPKRKAFLFGASKEANLEKRGFYAK